MRDLLFTIRLQLVLAQEELPAFLKTRNPWPTVCIKNSLVNIWFPQPGFHLARMTGWRLGLPCLNTFLRPCAFTFVLILTFCSVELTFVLHFIAFTLRIVLVSTFHCVSLHVLAFKLLFELVSH